MAARRKSRDDTGADSASQAMRESAQKIWLAGLGAFERAKSEGPKMFETLVDQGRNLGEKARESADQALRAMRESAAAGGRWDKLEQVFEDRVAKSLHRLGVLTTKEVDDLSRQVKALNENVRNLMRGRPTAPRAAPKKKAGARSRKAATKKKAAKA
ncbi:MAG TPA: phasin family protein [Usitatibacter sp.]|nr:phasin family protein [Usitatibacter sp.]